MQMCAVEMALVMVWQPVYIICAMFILLISAIIILFFFYPMLLNMLILNFISTKFALFWYFSINILVIEAFFFLSFIFLYLIFFKYFFSRLKHWYSYNVSEMFEVTFLRNFSLKRKPFLDLVEDLHKALEEEGFLHLANLLQPFIWKKSKPLKMTVYVYMTLESSIYACIIRHDQLW